MPQNIGVNNSRQEYEWVSDACQIILLVLKRNISFVLCFFFQDTWAKVRNRFDSDWYEIFLGNASDSMSNALLNTGNTNTKSTAMCEGISHNVGGHYYRFGGAMIDVY